MLLLLNKLNISRDQFLHLLTSRYHSPYLHRHRMKFLLGRVQLLSFFFAIIVPLWSIVDFFVFPAPQWMMLAALRLISGAIFLMIAWPKSDEFKLNNIFLLFTIMLAIPPVFYLLSIPIINGVELDYVGQIFAEFYGFLPFILLAGLSIFPLTILEVLLLGVPFIAVTAYGSMLDDGTSFIDLIGTLWLVCLILMVSMFSAISQLRYMIILVARSSLDPLTQTYTRQSGAEIIDMHFRVATRQEKGFTILFFDLDNFKGINDIYGHEQGDKMLCQFTNKLHKLLRDSDMIVRWGGEEFIAVLTNTNLDGAHLVIERITTHWFGNRPDGSTLTASIGVAERISDNADDWTELVTLADQRMYKAKNAGRAGAIFS